MQTGFDLSELSNLGKDFADYALKEMPKETKNFLRKQGDQLRKETASAAKKEFNRKTGNLIKGIKRGKVYYYKSDSRLAVRVYAGGKAHHANLLEYGHRIVTQSGEEKGFVKGKHIFEKSMNKFESKFEKNLFDFVDDILEI